MALDSTAASPTADSFFSLDEATAYFTARGVTAWTAANDTAKEQAARRGTSYLENAYRGKWVGLATTQTQALSWPRIDGSRSRGIGITYLLQDENRFEIPSDVVPTQVKRAAMEAALLSLNGTVLEPTLDRGGEIKSIDKSVGPLRKAITYADGAPILSRYTAIEGLLRGLVTGTPGASAGNISLVRA